MTVGDSLESWYHDAGVLPCGGLGGCLAAVAAASGGHALHVGVVLGAETDRSYVMPDLGALPAGARPDAGIMTLPVDSGSGVGTFGQATAHLTACLATQPPLAGAAGSAAPAPAVDRSVCSPAVYQPAHGRFVVDLRPFLSAWDRGRPRDGVALLEDPSGGRAQTWQLAFDRVGAKAGSAITSVLSVSIGSPPEEAEAPAATGGPPVAVPAPQGGAAAGAGAAPVPAATAGVPAVAPGPSPATASLPAHPAGSGPVAGPEARPVRTALVRAGFHTDRRELFVAVLLAPLLLGAGYLFFTRLFIHPIEIASQTTETMP